MTFFFILEEYHNKCDIYIATTQPTTQNNLKQLLLGWYYYRLQKTTTPPPHHHTTTPGLITILAFLDNRGKWFSVYDLIQLDKIWKTTSIFLMEDNLNFFNGRQPQIV
jgi:hypothetical protein